MLARLSFAMLRRAISSLERFRADRQGSIVIMFALSLAVIVGLGGAAIDYGRITQIQRRIIFATETTAEAASMRPDLLDRDLTDFAQRFFQANGGDKPPIHEVQFRIDGSSDGIRIRVAAKIPTSLLGMLGKPDVPIVVTRALPWRIVAKKKQRRRGNDRG